VTFNFRGAQAGLPYDFSVEIYGNSAVTVKMSMALVAMLILLFNLLK